MSFEIYSRCSNDHRLYIWSRFGKGLYTAIFDNVEDGLSLGRLQCFDFQAVNNAQYADLIEPLMVWLLRRINEVLYNPANLGVPKHILIEEIFSSMNNRQLLEGALASIKTLRKNPLRLLPVLAIRLLRSRRELLLENPALRQQLTVLKRRHPQHGLRSLTNCSGRCCGGSGMDWFWCGRRRLSVGIGPDSSCTGSGSRGIAQVQAGDA